MGFALSAFFARSSDDSAPSRASGRRLAKPSAEILPPADAILLARIRLGETAAFAALMTEYYPTLAPFVRRYVESSDATDDVLQELFVRIWERRTAWEVHGSIRAYLFAAARNSALHARARMLSRRRAEERGGAQAVADTEPFDVEVAVERRDLASIVQSVVAELPERCREIFRLNREQGLSYAEIAQVLGISVSTVKTQMGRALVVLDRRLGVLRT